jgi:cell division septal protein FtsQ
MTRRLQPQPQPEQNSPANRRLRKQPRVRRTEAVSWLSQPRVAIPPTAEQRRRRNNRKIQIPWRGLGQLAASSRWLSLGLLAVAVYAIYLVGMEENFYLTAIPVEGAASIPAYDIVEASGLAGAHVFTVDPVQAATAVGQIPGVVSASVTLQWPNLAQISVVEDTPIAIWEQAGQLYWINQHGRLLPARHDVAGLLHIYSELERPIAEELFFVPQPILDGALQLRRLRPSIDQLYHHPSGGLSYQDERGWRAYFGDGDDMHQKLVVYEQLADELQRNGVTPRYISVSNQRKPFYALQN